MSLEWSANAKGFDEFDRLLADLPERVENRVLQGAVTAAMREGAKSVRAAAPEDVDRPPESNQSYWDRKLRYGRLLDQIKVRASKRDKAKGMRGAYITTGQAFWGRMLELGTRHIAARPWFAPAFASAKDKILQVLAQRIGKGLEREAKKKS